MTLTAPQSGVNTLLTPNPMTPPGASSANLTRNTRAERARMPVALAVAEEVAIAHGVCIRPITQRVTDTLTRVRSRWWTCPAGRRWRSKCPPCAERGRRLRMHQCRTGWHADTDPIPDADPSTEQQRDLVAVRADVTTVRDDFLDLGDTDAAQAVTETLDASGRRAGRALGVRGSPRTRPGYRAGTPHPVHSTPAGRPGLTEEGDGENHPRADLHRPRRHRVPAVDVRHRHPALVRARTTARPGYRPIRARTTTGQAARDAIHFSRLLDRFVQNLRRVAGFDVQYFATVEPQRRLAPHAHFAIRGTIPRTLLRQVIAATYHQVWWPATDQPVYTGDTASAGVGPGRARGRLRRLPRSRHTGAVLPTFDEALDDLDAMADLYAATGNAHEIEPQHVVRFGDTVRRQGPGLWYPGRRPAHRLPGQVPDQRHRPLPRRHRRRPHRGRAHGSDGRGAEVRAVLADLRELAAVRHPTQERQRRHDTRRMQGQSAQA